MRDDGGLEIRDEKIRGGMVGMEGELGEGMTNGRGGRTGVAGEPARPHRESSLVTESQNSITLSCGQ